MYRRRTGAHCRRVGRAAMDAWRAPHAALGSRSRSAYRSSPRRRSEPPDRRRCCRAAAPATADETASGDRALRRQRFDGALFADAAAVCACPDEEQNGCRGLFVFDRADARDAPHAQAPSRRGAGSALTRGTGLVRGHADRRGAPLVQSAVGASGAERRTGGRAHLRRVGPRRPGAAGARDRAAAAQLPSFGLAEPAARHRALRAADERTPGSAALRR